jgi:hypothetical protein
MDGTVRCPHATTRGHGRASQALPPHSAHRLGRPPLPRTRTRSFSSDLPSGSSLYSKPSPAARRTAATPTAGSHRLASPQAPRARCKWMHGAAASASSSSSAEGAPERGKGRGVTLTLGDLAPHSPTHLSVVDVTRSICRRNEAAHAAQGPQRRHRQQRGPQVNGQHAPGQHGCGDGGAHARRHTRHAT